MVAARPSASGKRQAAGGSDVVFSYHRNRERADQLVEELQQSGVSASALPCDNWKGIESGIFLQLKGQDFNDAWIEAAKANTALKRFGRAEGVVEAAMFLASAQAADITGQAIKLDGGYSL